MDVSNGKREPKVSFSFFKGPLDKSSENGSVKNSRDHGNGNDSNTNSPPSKHRKFMTKATKSAENHSNGLSTGKDKAKNSETFKGMKDENTIWIKTPIIDLVYVGSVRGS